MKGHIQFFLLILLWSTTFAINWRSNSPYVKISLGEIEGYYKTSENGHRYAAFESVPYAQPPVGKLRFEPPLPVQPWCKVIKALSLPPACPQYHRQGVEDCLYLNIYVPVTNENSLPVIFWIFGGGFQVGSSNYCSPKYLMDKNVILVTFNYRLGILGFLSTLDDVVPGNMGLKDQSLALKWISENIKFFGGDPRRISLMGDSAGGASVHYHYLSPQSRGLFKNGISFSGSALNPWAFDHCNTFDRVKSLATILKCPVNDSSSMVQCFKNKLIGDLIESTHEISTKEMLKDNSNIYVRIPSLPFIPVAEKTAKNYFINDTPQNILEKGEIYDAPWIVGIVQDEGLFMTAQFFSNKTLVENTDKNWEIVGPLLLLANKVLPSSQQIIVANKARKHYFGDKSITVDVASLMKLTRLLGDATIGIGNIRAAKLQAKVNKSPVRFYHYTFRSAQSMFNTAINEYINFGVSHGDDTLFVLGNTAIAPTSTANDKAMLQDMLNYWYSVANKGTPDLGTNWQPVNSSSEFHYIEIAGPKNFTMQSNNNFGEILFWDQTGF